MQIQRSFVPSFSIDGPAGFPYHYRVDDAGGELTQGTEGERDGNGQCDLPGGAGVVR